MKNNKVKRVIYLRIFSAFLAIFLLLMIGFSVFFVFEQKKVAKMALQTEALQISMKVEEILKKHIDSERQIKDISKVKKEFANESNFFIFEDTEIAVFTGDYQLLFNTNNYWKVSYSYNEGGNFLTEYGFLNPKDWFSDEEVKEIERYVYANPKAEKEGDLSGYTVDVKGFWVDNEMIIPKQITVNEMYAQKFDDNGDIVASGGTHTDHVVYESTYHNTEGLPYFDKLGGIMPEYGGNPNNEKQNELRQWVNDKDYLKEALLQAPAITSSSQRLNLLNYRLYWAQPYGGAADWHEEQGLSSDFWVVVGRDINLWERGSSTLVFVWLSCFSIFLIGALILSRQTYKTYEKREELEKQRKEMTNALAHDLKTPLSIISGYAQNLQENILTEKRGHYIVQIQANIDRMDKIIREMLEMARLESNSFKMNMEEISLYQLCNEVMMRYEPICREKSITIQLEGDAIVKADRSLMGRVIDNLLVNAIEHMPDGGNIHMSIADHILEVYNSGSHIPEEKMEEIWLPFEKGDTSRRNTKGTGLGLTISRAILDMHKFPSGVKNREDGVLFWFKFR